MKFYRNLVAYFSHHPVQIRVQTRCLQAFNSYVIGIRHFPNGFDDLLGNEVTTPELTIADSGRYLDIAMDNDAPTDARIDVYMSNSLGHHLPGYIFSSGLSLHEREIKQVSLQLLTFRKFAIQNLYKWEPVIQTMAIM